ncbi:MAG: hypothetical protein M3341_12750 [Actinomycetota bacterium]|nr:hypothetical protein [Actinomycetota bacterium]
MLHGKEDMRHELSAGGVRHSRYPVIENKIQAGIMTHVHAEARAVSRARLNEVSDSSRGKISAEVARLVELGLLAEEGLSESEGGRRSALVGIPRSAGLVVAVDWRPKSRRSRAGSTAADRS